MTATEESVSDAEREIAQYYNTYQAIFTNNVCNAYIYGQVSFSDPDQLIYPGLYNRLDQFVQSTTGVAPMLAKYIEPAEACYDSEGNPLQGFDSIKSPPGSLVIKCNKDGSSLPIVQFITPDIQYHAACVWVNLHTEFSGQICYTIYTKPIIIFFFSIIKLFYLDKMEK